MTTRRVSLEPTNRENLTRVGVNLAGRVFNGSPASLNLRIPPYSFPSSLKLVVGVDETHQGAA